MDTLFAQVDTYIESLLASENKEKRQALERIVSAGFANQSISPVQGKLLQCLMTSCQAQRVLELGTFAGYSTLWLAEALPENGRLITIEYDETHTLLAKETFNASSLKSKIELRQGKALDIMEAMLDHQEPPFDFFY
jgi:predicted O-methyltransferase YrrM